MNNTFLIARREYLERIRTKAFLIATILIPLLLGGLVFGSGYLMKNTQSALRIAILGGGTLAVELQHQLEADKDNTAQVTLAADTADARAHFSKELRNRQSKLSGYLEILPGANPTARPRFLYTPRTVSDINTATMLKDAIADTLTRGSLGSRGMAPAEVDALLTPVDLDTSAVGDTRIAFYAAYVLFFLLYFVIMQFGMNTARSIIEEKTSRVFEVMLATIQPNELLAGKIIGVGAVGLTQIAVWMLAAAGAGLYLAAQSGTSLHAILSVRQVSFFILFFLFGFLIYSSIAACLGAMTNSEQELQQLNMFLVLPLAFCMLMITVIIKNPDSTLARVASLIPFCTPLLMNFRISIGNPQPWEIGLSFVLMTLTIAIILWIASRIYRVGILMYGKKPSLPEILRWLRYT